jgi:pimeloyl-ACP methyl ester carboxylesterase
MRPFRIETPQAEIDELHRRIAATRWPGELPDVGWDRGIPLGYVKELADYWLNRFDWRAAEAKLNRYPQFVTEIDGVDVHFMHVRSPEPGATPLILTHGWPGSFAEFVDVIEPLTNPTAHGGDAADAFHVVVPSIPGYGYSSAPAETGWDTDRVARAWAELMRQLGYVRYVAQGGDWGMPITLKLALADPEHVIGVHLNMFAAFPPEDPAAFADLSEADQARLGFTLRLAQAPVDPPADAVLRADRLTGRAARLDRGEVQGVDRLGQGPRGRGRPRPVADHRDDLLAQRQRRVERPAVLRVQPPRHRLRPYVGRSVAAGHAGRGGQLPGGRRTARP